MDEDLPLIKVVGISASGKSTLVRGLRQAGYRARPVSQEHSNVPDLWQQLDRPVVLIYLDVDLATQRQRRPDVSWSRRWWQTEFDRLVHAREYADLRINTVGMDDAQVLLVAHTFLQHAKIPHADHPLPPVKATGSATSTLPT